MDKDEKKSKKQGSCGGSVGASSSSRAGANSCVGRCNKSAGIGNSRNI